MTKYRFPSIKKVIEFIIFESKWLLTLFYIGLILVLGAYCFFYVKEVYELVRHVGLLTKDGMLITALELLDIVMIANLIKMINSGSYNSFVSKSHGRKGENVSSGELKLNMAKSLIGVSSIHLLQEFVSPVPVDPKAFFQQIIIHSSFLIGALIFAIINYLHSKETSHETDDSTNVSDSPAGHAQQLHS